jgi:hypothetical protein
LSYGYFWCEHAVALWRRGRGLLKASTRDTEHFRRRITATRRSHHIADRPDRVTSLASLKHAHESFLKTPGDIHFKWGPLQTGSIISKTLAVNEMSGTTKLLFKCFPLQVEGQCFLVLPYKLAATIRKEKAHGYSCPNRT